MEEEKKNAFPQVRLCCGEEHPISVCQRRGGALALKRLAEKMPGETSRGRYLTSYIFTIVLEVRGQILPRSPDLYLRERLRGKKTHRVSWPVNHSHSESRVSSPSSRRRTIQLGVSAPPAPAADLCSSRFSTLLMGTAEALWAGQPRRGVPK